MTQRKKAPATKAPEKSEGATWKDSPDLVLELANASNAKTGRLTEPQWAQFWYMCQKLDLDPLAGEIHAQLRKQKDTDARRLTIITGIGGYRILATRTGRYSPGPIAWGEDGAGQYAEATVYMLRPDGQGAEEWHQVTRRAYLSEYGGVGTIWVNMPHNQLGKCAEALALRTAFPGTLEGVYTAEEMQQADKKQPTARRQAPEEGPPPQRDAPEDVPTRDVDAIPERQEEAPAESKAQHRENQKQRKAASAAAISQLWAMKLEDGSPVWTTGQMEDVRDRMSAEQTAEAWELLLDEVKERTDERMAQGVA